MQLHSARRNHRLSLALHPTDGRYAEPLPLRPKLRAIPMEAVMQIIHAIGLLLAGAFIGAMAVCAAVPLVLNAATKAMLRGRN